MSIYLLLVNRIQEGDSLSFILIMVNLSFLYQVGNGFNAFAFSLSHV